MVKEAKTGGVAAITSKRRAVAYIIGKERLGSILETVEILANPEAMRAIRDYESGRTKSYSLDAIAD